MGESKLCLYASCIPVKGFKRSLICDLQRGKFFFIPNALYQIINEHCKKSIEEILASFDIENHMVIRQYLDFLINNDLCFFTDHPERFPQLELNWDAPSKITNALIDVNELSTHPFVSIFQQLDEFNCLSIQLRYFSTVEIDKLRSVLEACKFSRIRSINILVPFQEDVLLKDYQELCLFYKRIKQITVHSSPHDTLHKNLELKTNIAYIKDFVSSADHCGIIHPVHFRTHIQFFTESQNFNTCLNRKLSIDTEGKIKNCPAMLKDYGNIHTHSLKEIVSDQSFKSIWEINKSQIDICKDCEFKHVCTDCRAFLSDPLSINSKPQKCSYDPYTAKWDNPEDDPKELIFQKFNAHQIDYIA